MPVLDANEIMFTAFEPKVQNRFIMYIDGIPSYLIKSATAPGFEAGEIILDHINVYRKVKGKVRWNIEYIKKTAKSDGVFAPTTSWVS